MSNKKGPAPKNADKLQEGKPLEETKPLADDQVIIVGTGTGLLENGAKYTCNKETADFHIARGYATLKTTEN